MPTIAVPSFAKLNLYLRVAGTRSDGYHDIETVFERISLADTVAVSAARGGDIRVRCRYPGIPLDERNLCWRAARELRERFKVAGGCEIVIRKRIPPGAGMGGGSSNAAAALTGLCRLWRLRPSPSELMKIGASIGSDVPFFLSGARYAIGRGKGERLRLLPVRGPVLYHVVAVPPVHVSTKEIYEKWDFSRSPAELTTPAANATMIFTALKRRDLGALTRALRNDLERVAGKGYPEIVQMKARLSQEPGVAGALMTGSGSAVFAVFSSRSDAARCARRFKRGTSHIFYAETR